MGELARQLRDGAERPALPAGAVRAERVKQLRLAERDLSLYALHGLDLMPSTPGCATATASCLPGLPGLGRHGARRAERPGPPLENAQRRARDAHLTTLAKRLAHPLPGLTVIKNVRWFDAPAARLRAGPLTCSCSRSHRRHPPGWLAANAGVQQLIDGSGRTLLPGLIGMHAHVEAQPDAAQPGRWRHGRARCGQQLCRPQPDAPAHGQRRAARPAHRGNGFIEGRARSRPRPTSCPRPGAGPGRHRLVCRAWLPPAQALQLHPPRVGEAHGPRTPLPWACVWAAMCRPS